MFSDLLKFWKQLYLTHKEGKLSAVMYYYLVCCLFIMAGLFMYLYWEGTIGIMILMNTITGNPMNIEFNILKSIGVVLIIRYALLSGIDAVARRTPDNITDKLTLLNDKVNALHRLAFEFEDEDDAPKIIDRRTGK